MRYPASTQRLFKYAVAVISVALAATATVLGQGDADTRPPLTPEEERLVQRVKEAVMDEIINSPALQQQIELGIRRYVEEQRAAARDRQQQAASVRARNMLPVSADRDHIYGEPDAVISLVEYSDFECPYCKRFHATARATVDRSDGSLNWVYRHYPLDMHDPGATREALASECAAELGGDEAFWKYADAVFERTTSNGNGFPASQLVPLATEIGLNPDKFEECLESEKHRARVEEDKRNGTAIGIRGTPGNVLVNNETGEMRLIPGAVPLERLQAEVQELME